MPNLIRSVKLLLTLSLFFAGIGEVKAEVVDNFSVEYNIEQSSSVEVHEVIVYNFEEDNRHGIYRTLSKRHAQGPTTWYKNRLVDIDVLYVTRGGKKEPYVLYDHGDEIEIKIGDANKTITGKQEYEITYLLNGALSYGGEGAEFYWNVTGNNWTVPI